MKQKLVSTYFTSLQDGWNVLDFVVVVVGLVGILPGVPSLTSLRTFRVLRPLRTLSRLPGMRKLVGSLLQSIPGLFNVVVLLAFIFVIFGILGLQLWNGKLHNLCRTTGGRDGPSTRRSRTLEWLSTSYTMQLLAALCM